VNVEERKKNAHFRDATDAFDLNDFPICRRNDDGRVVRNPSRWIAKEECDEECQCQQNRSEYEPGKPERRGSQDNQGNQKAEGVSDNHEMLVVLLMRQKERGTAPCPSSRASLRVLMAQLVSKISDQCIHLVFKMQFLLFQCDFFDLILFGKEMVGLKLLKFIFVLVVFFDQAAKIRI
jgi:hypothetical protein